MWKMTGLGWWYVSVTEVASESVWGIFNLSYRGLLVEISLHAQKDIFIGGEAGAHL